MWKRKGNIHLPALCLPNRGGYDTINLLQKGWAEDAADFDFGRRRSRSGRCAGLFPGLPRLQPRDGSLHQVLQGFRQVRPAAELTGGSACRRHPVGAGQRHCDHAWPCGAVRGHQRYLHRPAHRLRRDQLPAHR